MPPTKVLFYREADGTVPVLDWITALALRDRRVRDKCLARIDALSAFGRELRRPYADTIGDGLWELRMSFGHVNYRILYFFDGHATAVLVHAFTRNPR